MEISKNLRKSSPDPPKIDAKTVLNDVLKGDRIKNALGELPDDFLAPFFRILSRLGPQDGPMLEAKTDPKSIKNRCEKG